MQIHAAYFNISLLVTVSTPNPEIAWTSLHSFNLQNFSFSGCGFKLGTMSCTVPSMLKTAWSDLTRKCTRLHLDDRHKYSRKAWAHFGSLDPIQQWSTEGNITRQQEPYLYRTLSLEEANLKITASEIRLLHKAKNNHISPISLSHVEKANGKLSVCAAKECSQEEWRQKLCEICLLCSRECFHL